MSIETGPGVPSPKKELQDFNAFVAREMPNGLAGHENAFPVEVGNNQLEVIIFGAENDKISFGLFVRRGTYTPQRTPAGESGRYSRKSLEISKDGEVTEDTIGTLPDFDLTDNEPDFTGFSNEEIASQVVKQIKNYKRPNAN